MKPCISTLFWKRKTIHIKLWNICLCKLIISLSIVKDSGKGCIASTSRTNMGKLLAKHLTQRLIKNQVEVSIIQTISPLFSNILLVLHFNTHMFCIMYIVFSFFICRWILASKFRRKDIWLWWFLYMSYQFLKYSKILKIYFKEILAANEYKHIFPLLYWNT